MKKVLSNKLYLSVLFTDLLSNFGDVLYYMALMNYILLLPDTKLALALLGFSEMIPLFTRMVLSYVADRKANKLQQIVATQVLRCLLYLLVGFAMSFTPALWIVLVAIVVNLISDLAGQYENALYLPVSLRMVSNEDREAALGLSMGLGVSGNILFQAIGASLITILAYSTLAYVNALTFAVCAVLMGLLLPKIQRKLDANPIQLADKKEGIFSIQEFKDSLQLVVKEVFRIDVLKRVLILIPIINGLGSAVDTLVVLIISEFPDFVLINAPTTIAAISMTMSIGAIVGSLVGSKLFKKLDMFAIVGFCGFLLVLVFSALLIRQIHLVLLVLFFIGIVTGGVNPKLQALLFNSLPEEQMAFISGSLRTYFSLGIALSRFLLSSLMLFIPPASLVWVCLLISLGLVVYTISTRKKV
ncbi:MFS transporter [Streptococcus rifensis]